MRQIVLDTETTGLEVKQGHRIIEIGCVELLHRRPTQNDFHRYINPERTIDRGASEVHGIYDEDLKEQPRFAELAPALWQYLAGAELVIHNAAFDIGFLDEEFRRAGVGEPLSQACEVVDTVSMARQLHPGQKASLDALCKRYGVDNSNRELHGALLDAKLLADVYLAMTGGQSALSLDMQNDSGGSDGVGWLSQFGLEQRAPKLIRATDEELAAHQRQLARIEKKAGRLIWRGEADSA
ncbi:MAG: DNA polymerase III subunit epsilon [Panacagrimonas sp.]